MRPLLAAIGLGCFLLAWQLVGHYRLAGLSWPAVSEVLAVLADPDRWPLFGRALVATLRATALGYSAGAALGLSAAIVTHLWPPARAGTDRLAAMIHSVPSIALAPVFIVFLSRESTPAA